MARDFEYTFELAGNLAGSFTSSFRQANVTVLQSQQRIENLQNKLQQLDEDYQNGVISAKKYEAQKKRLNATLEKERNNLSQLQEELSLTNRIGSAFSEVVTPYLSFGAALGAVSFGVHTLVTDLDSLQNSLRAVQAVPEQLTRKWQVCVIRCLMFMPADSARILPISAQLWETSGR